MLGDVAVDGQPAGIEDIHHELSTPSASGSAERRYRRLRWRNDARLTRYAAAVAFALHPIGGLTDLAILGLDWRLLPLLGARLLASAAHVPIMRACACSEPPRRVEGLVALGFIMSALAGVLVPTILRPTSVASQGGPLLLILVLYALVFPVWRARKISAFLVVSTVYLGIGAYWRGEVGYGGSHELITIAIFLVAIGTLIPKVNQRIEQTERERFIAQDELTHTIEQLQHQVRLRQRREQALEQARARAERADASKTSFMANVSHELRTPLVGILGVTELLRGPDPPRSREEQERIELLQRSGDYLLRLVNDLLDYFKLEADRVELDQVPVSPHALATATTALLAPRAREHGVPLRLELDPALAPWILGDPVRLQQIMLNLVGNAVKFTSAGFVAVRVSSRAVLDGDALVVEVEDTGIGMDASFIDRMFEPFEQSGGVEWRAQGTGLGLAITRRFVQQMGGTIRVDSTLGVGTTIRVTLPLRTTEAPADAAPAAPEPSARAPRRVLLAEDNDVNAKVLVAMLRRLGHDVTHAHDGQELLERVTQERFDIVLTDVFMPRLDGLGAAAKIRALPGPERTIPILALTADAFEDRRAALRAAGIDDVVVKPVSLERLANVLETHARPRDRPASTAGASRGWPSPARRAADEPSAARRSEA